MGHDRHPTVDGMQGNSYGKEISATRYREQSKELEDRSQQPHPIKETEKNDRPD